MTRQPYDQTAKQLLQTALAEAGQVVVEYEVRGEPQRVDVLFERDPDAPALPGLVGRIAERACLIEVFSQPPGLDAVRDCFSKQLLVERDRRGDRAVEEEIIPLWIISAGRPRSVIERFGLRRRRGWPRGVYGAGAGYGWNVVVVSELPSTRETLLLRLLGTGATRDRAVADFGPIPPDTWEARAGNAALRVLLSLGVLPERGIEREIAMAVVEKFDVWLARERAEAREEGLEKGLERGLGPVLRQFERKLGRLLTAQERAQLVDRLDRLGPERLGDVVLDLDAVALAAWLTDPTAR
jgi:hypothetical protein